MERLRRASRRKATARSDSFSPSSDATEASANRPFALVETVSNQVRIAALNEAASNIGLRAGQAHADARAAYPRLISESIDRESDSRIHSVLGLWCERFSPSVAPEGRDGWRLDGTGVSHLFGGEGAYLENILNSFEKLGFSTRVTMAGSYGAAHALARYGRDRMMRVGPGEDELKGALTPLPVEALRIDDGTALTLRRLGLKTVGALMEAPRAALARRFGGALTREAGAALVRRLDEALGRAAEPMAPIRPPAAFAVRRSLLEPVLSIEPIEAVLPDLAAELARDLEREGRAAASVRLGVFQVDGTVSEIFAHARTPSRDPVHLVRLLKEKLDRLEAGFGVDALVLAAPDAPRADHLQRRLDGPDAADGVARAVDRIAARIGGEQVFRLAPEDAWLPEAAQTPSGDATPRPWPAPRPRPAAGPARPPTLLAKPEPVEAIADLPDGPPARFVWRRVARRVVKASGPERLETPWHARPGRPAPARDYYRVEDDQGRRYWLFREGLYERGPLFVGEDLFAPEPEAVLEWYVHGIFP
ncbi:MAG: DNA polymerase Y family protein [Pseudomonadota bacterium]